MSFIIEVIDYIIYKIFSWLNLVSKASHNYLGLVASNIIS